MPAAIGLAPAGEPLLSRGHLLSVLPLDKGCSCHVILILVPKHRAVLDQRALACIASLVGPWGAMLGGVSHFMFVGEDPNPHCADDS